MDSRYTNRSDASGRDLQRPTGFLRFERPRDLVTPRRRAEHMRGYSPRHKQRQSPLKIMLPHRARSEVTGPHSAREPLMQAGRTPPVWRTGQILQHEVPQCQTTRERTKEELMRLELGISPRLPSKHTALSRCQGNPRMRDGRRRGPERPSEDWSDAFARNANPYSLALNNAVTSFLREDGSEVSRSDTKMHPGGLETLHELREPSDLWRERGTRLAYSRERPKNASEPYPDPMQATLSRFPTTSNGDQVLDESPLAPHLPLLSKAYNLGEGMGRKPAKFVERGLRLDNTKERLRSKEEEFEQSMQEMEAEGDRLKKSFKNHKRWLRMNNAAFPAPGVDTVKEGPHFAGKAVSEDLKAMFDMPVLAVPVALNLPLSEVVAHHALVFRIPKGGIISRPGHVGIVLSGAVKVCKQPLEGNGGEPNHAMKIGRRSLIYGGDERPNGWSSLKEAATKFKTAAILSMGTFSEMASSESSKPATPQEQPMGRNTSRHGSIAPEEQERLDMLALREVTHQPEGLQYVAQEDSKVAWVLTTEGKTKLPGSSGPDFVRQAKLDLDFALYMDHFKVLDIEDRGLMLGMLTRTYCHAEDEVMLDGPSNTARKLCKGLCNPRGEYLYLWKGSVKVRDNLDLQSGQTKIVESPCKDLLGGPGVEIIATGNEVAVFYLVRGHSMVHMPQQLRDFLLRGGALYWRTLPVARFLKGVQLTSHLTADERWDVAKRMELRTVAEGEVLLRAGSSCSELYIVYEGEAAEMVDPDSSPILSPRRAPHVQDISSPRRRGRAGIQKKLRIHRRCQFFGNATMFLHKATSNIVVHKPQTKVLVLSSNAFAALPLTVQGFLKAHIELHDHAKERIAVLRLAPQLQFLQTPELHAIAMLMHPVEYDVGETVPLCKAGGMYVIESGEFHVHCRANEGSHHSMVSLQRSSALFAYLPALLESADYPHHLRAQALPMLEILEIAATSKGRIHVMPTEKLQEGLTQRCIDALTLPTAIQENLEHKRLDLEELTEFAGADMHDTWELTKLLALKDEPVVFAPGELLISQVQRVTASLILVEGSCKADDGPEHMAPCLVSPEMGALKATTLVRAWQLLPDVDSRIPVTLGTYFANPVHPPSAQGP